MRSAGHRTHRAILPEPLRRRQGPAEAQMAAEAAAFAAATAAELAAAVSL